MPESEIVSDGFEAFEVMVTLPLALPVVVGANFTRKRRALPGGEVSGVVIPLKVNPVPLMAGLRNRDARAASVGDCRGKRLIASDGHVSEAETGRIGAQCPNRHSSSCTEIETVRVGFEAFDVIVTLPVALPVVVGANFAVSDVLCPAARVSGVVIPLNVKPVPLMAA